MENSYLSEFKNREYFNQCTNSEGLEQLMNKKKIRAYIGFDCTAPSLHVGSLLQIMCLRLLQKHGHQPIILLGKALASLVTASTENLYPLSCSKLYNIILILGTFEIINE